MSFVVRLAIYVPVLLLIAFVVVGQHHETAKETVNGGLRRTGRWIAWTAALVLVMLALEYVFNGW